MRLIERNKRPSNLGAPRVSSTTERIMDTLSKAISEFTYDLESNCTFENWYNRYRELFTVDASSLDDSAKIRLLLSRTNEV